MLSLFSLAVSYAAVHVALRQERVASDTLFISVARDVHERYDRLYQTLDSLPEKGFDQLNSEQKRVVSRYVNLCAEEFLWKQKGIVDADVW